MSDIRRGIPEAVTVLDLLTRTYRTTQFRDPTVEEIRQTLETTVVITDPADPVAERAAAERDGEVYGVGFLVDGRRVDPAAVVLYGSFAALTPVPR